MYLRPIVVVPLTTMRHVLTFRMVASNPAFPILAHPFECCKYRLDLCEVDSIQGQQQRKDETKGGESLRAGGCGDAKYQHETILLRPIRQTIHRAMLTD
jgi:hypothetical protein